MRKCQKLQFLEWPLEADTWSEPISIDSHVKMNFTNKKTPITLMKANQTQKQQFKQRNSEEAGVRSTRTSDIITRRPQADKQTD